MVVYGGCGEVVDLNLPRNPVSEVNTALDDCYVFHLGGFAPGKGPLRSSVEAGDGLWVRVPGSCGLGGRVCPSATGERSRRCPWPAYISSNVMNNPFASPVAVAGGAIIVFGGSRGKVDIVDGKGETMRYLKDARIIDAESLLQLDLVD